MDPGKPPKMHRSGRGSTAHPENDYLSVALFGLEGAAFPFLRRPRLRESTILFTPEEALRIK